MPLIELFDSRLTHTCIWCDGTGDVILVVVGLLCLAVAIKLMADWPDSGQSRPRTHSS